MLRFSLVLAAGLLVFACNGNKKDTTDGDETGEPSNCDADNDGFLSVACDGGIDCDDSSPDTNPNAVEVCDGQDNNCDGNVDDGVSTTYYEDGDKDGFGSQDSTTEACEKPAGYVTSGTDCDDGDAANFPGKIELCDGQDNNCDGNVDEGVRQTYYRDSDGDGYGDPETAQGDCTAPSGFVSNGEDCDDTTSDAQPGRTEICDERDNDCDGNTDEGVMTAFYADVDDDGYGNPGEVREACTRPTGYSSYNTDCDDDAAEVSPVALEVCDLVDNDCDGRTDEDEAVDAPTWYEDADADSYGNASVHRQSCALPEGWVPNPEDCDDTSAAVNPDVLETCNSIDDDCDFVVDEPDAWDAPTWFMDRDTDGWGDAALSQRACAQPTGYVADSTDCDDLEKENHPGAVEVCDSDDNDCDGAADEPDAVDATTWYQDADEDGWGLESASLVACDTPPGHTLLSGDCDDSQPAASPSSTEVCDEIDNDCDASVDEPHSADATTWYQDYDADGFGNSASSRPSCTRPEGFVEDRTDCNDMDALVNPSVVEVCNTVDDDCDGTADEADAADARTCYRDLDKDTWGDPADSTRACTCPTGTVEDGTDCDDLEKTTHPGADEYCDGEDDNCDGVTDESTAEDALRWYADLDRDGYGDAADSLVACTRPSGTLSYSNDDTDCDDTNSTINPRMAEVCNDQDDDCNGAIDDGIQGTDSDCPAEDCVAVLADNPDAASGTYWLEPVAGAGVWDWYCDMDTEGGGWVRVADAVWVWGKGYDGTWHNSAGFRWSQALFAYNSGSVLAGSWYPDALPYDNPIGFQFTGEGWGIPMNYEASLCGSSVVSYETATTYVDMDDDGLSTDFIVSRTESSHMIHVATLEGALGCATSDNSGSAAIDVYLRHY